MKPFDGERPHGSGRAWTCSIALLALASLGATNGGCANSECSRWAQYSPTIPQSHDTANVSTEPARVDLGSVD